MSLRKLMSYLITLSDSVAKQPVKFSNHHLIWRNSSSLSVGFYPNYVVENMLWRIIYLLQKKLSNKANVIRGLNSLMLSALCCWLLCLIHILTGYWGYATRLTVTFLSLGIDNHNTSHFITTSIHTTSSLYIHTSFLTQNHKLIYNWQFIRQLNSTNPSRTSLLS